MKLLSELIGPLAISLALHASFCWSMGPVVGGAPMFFPGEPSAGLSGMVPQSLDVMTMMMAQDQSWLNEGIPGLNGVLKPDDDEAEWSSPWLGRTEGIATGEGFLSPPESTVWEKARKAVEELIAYIKPGKIPGRQINQETESRIDPVKEALGEANKESARSHNALLEDSDNEKEREVYNHKSAGRFMQRQKEREESSFFVSGHEDGQEVGGLATTAEHSDLSTRPAFTPDTMTVYDQTIPRMALLHNGKPPAKRVRTEGEGQKEGGAGDNNSGSHGDGGASPSAPPLGGATGLTEEPPSYAEVVSGQVPPGRPTMVFRDGRLVQVHTLPLATDVTQVYEMTPGAEQLANPAAAFPPSTQRVEQLGDKQEAILRATAELEIPVGLVNRFSGLREYHLDIIVDDSGSMDGRDTGLSYSSSGWPQLTRMEELKNRLRSMSRLLSLVAERGISFRKLSDYNNPECISGDQSPELIECKLRQAIDKLYPCSSTPLNGAVQRSFEDACRMNRQTIAYVFTDGEPNDNPLFETPEQSFKNTIRRIRERKRADFFPIGLMACTDKEECIRWMNELDVSVQNVQVMDDYFSEKKEVYDHHGGLLPYTLGMYITAGLLGPIDQVLDNMDESRIYEKWQVEDLMGYGISKQQYLDYRAQAKQAREDRVRRARSWAAASHPLDQVNRRPLEVNGQRLFRIVDGYVQPDHETDYTAPSQRGGQQQDLREPDPCPSCIIL